MGHERIQGTIVSAQYAARAASRTLHRGHHFLYKVGLSPLVIVLPHAADAAYAAHATHAAYAAHAAAGTFLRGHRFVYKVG